MGYAIPYTSEQSGLGESRMDIYSRLLKDRIVFLDEAIDDRFSALVVAQLLFLESQDPDKDIALYINSPGGSVTAGLAIIDTIQYVKCDIQTICVGQAASMGALILAAGTKGKRFALPSSRIMIHQVWGGAQGQAKDIKIQAKEILRLKNQTIDFLAGVSGKTSQQIAQDMERDYYMSAQEAIEYGILDKLLVRDKNGQK